MRHTVRLDIDLPRARVIELFDDPDNLAAWQPGLLSFEHFEGEPGQPGAKSRLRYKMGKREIEMVETILVRDLPDVFSGTYEAKGVWNEVINRFTEPEVGRTSWEVETEFRCSGMMRIMSVLKPVMFKKETRGHMERFKAFAEAAEIARPASEA